MTKAWSDHNAEQHMLLLSWVWLQQLVVLIDHTALETLLAFYSYSMASAGIQRPNFKERSAV